LLDGVLHVWDQCCSILRFSKEPSIPILKIFKNEELSNSIFLNEKTRSRKQRPQGVLTKKRRCNNGGLDTRYARMWIVHYFAPVQNEGGKIHTNHINPLQRWNY